VLWGEARKGGDMIHSTLTLFFRKILDGGYRHPVALGLVCVIMMALLAAALLPLFF